MRSIRSSRVIRHEGIPTCTSLINLCLSGILLLCWDTVTHCLSAHYIHVWQYSRGHFLFRLTFHLQCSFLERKSWPHLQQWLSVKGRMKGIDVLTDVLRTPRFCPLQWKSGLVQIVTSWQCNFLQLAEIQSSQSDSILREDSYTRGKKRQISITKWIWGHVPSPGKPVLRQHPAQNWGIAQPC